MTEKKSGDVALQVTPSTAIHGVAELRQAFGLSGHLSSETLMRLDLIERGKDVERRTDFKSSDRELAALACLAAARDGRRDIVLCFGESKEQVLEFVYLLGLNAGFADMWIRGTKPKPDQPCGYQIGFTREDRQALGLCNILWANSVEQLATIETDYSQCLLLDGSKPRRNKEFHEALAKRFRSVYRLSNSAIAAPPPARKEAPCVVM